MLAESPRQHWPAWKKSRQAQLVEEADDETLLGDEYSQDWNTTYSAGRL